MKRLLAVTLLLGLPICIARAQDTTTAWPTQQVPAEIRTQLSDDSATAAPAQAHLAAPDPALVMAPYIVLKGYQRRALDQAIADEVRRRELEKFSLIRGGALWQKEIGKVKVALGGWSDGNALSLLRISW